MNRSIDDDVGSILDYLAGRRAEEGPHSSSTGEEISRSTGLEPDRVNVGTSILVDSGLAEWIQTFGTAPFTFREAQVTPRGLYERDRAIHSTTPTAEPVLTFTEFRPPSPVGSPFGFTDQDWETVLANKADPTQLRVVFGYQFKSEHYETAALKKNLRRTFQSAVSAYNSRPNTRPVTLHFRPLAAAYGEHQFNDIARDIISADIAVFETSDLNPNVMIEMGVALTWGVRVLPIKKRRRRKPPSDISGQTWVDYEESAVSFVDRDHNEKLVAMIDRAMRKKVQP
jgi:hypothetical protein